MVAVAVALVLAVVVKKEEDEEAEAEVGEQAEEGVGVEAEGAEDLMHQRDKCSSREVRRLQRQRKTVRRQLVPFR